MNRHNPAKVANLNRKTLRLFSLSLWERAGVRVFPILFAIILLLSACVDPTPTPGSDSSPSYDATATYGAEEFCKQRAALGDPCQ